jgi:hypothetical protein
VESGRTVDFDGQKKTNLTIVTLNAENHKWTDTSAKNFSAFSEFGQTLSLPALVVAVSVTRLGEFSPICRLIVNFGQFF